LVSGFKGTRRKTRPTCISTTVTQGDSLSATLFNVVLNMTLEGTAGKTDIVQKSKHIFTYA